MSKKRLGFLTLILTVIALASILMASCARPGTTASTGGSNSNSGNGSSAGGNSNEVHMTATNFAQPSVNIAKGAKLTLIDDVAVPHILENGFYDANGTPKPAKEAGAPTVNVNFAGSDTKDIGPFTTAGTYHIYCTIHLNMNLTITVK